jgi:hypothetical protein
VAVGGAAPQLTGLPSGDVTVDVSAEGYFPARVGHRIIGVDAPLTVVLDAGGTIRGRVIDSSGRGLGGLAMFVYGASLEEDTWDHVSPVYTDPKGRFALHSPSGHRTVGLLPDLGWDLVPLETVDVEEGKESRLEIHYPSR